MILLIWITAYSGVPLWVVSAPPVLHDHRFPCWLLLQLVHTPRPTHLCPLRMELKDDYSRKKKQWKKDCIFSVKKKKKNQYSMFARTVLLLVARRSMLAENANSIRRKHTIQLKSIVTLHKWRWTVRTRQQTLFTTKIPESNICNTTHFHHAART